MEARGWVQIADEVACIVSTIAAMRLREPDVVQETQEFGECTNTFAESSFWIPEAADGSRFRHTQECENDPQIHRRLSIPKIGTWLIDSWPQESSMKKCSPLVDRSIVKEAGLFQNLIWALKVSIY